MDGTPFFRLRPGGVYCDGDGPRVAHFSLLDKIEGHGWTLRPAEEIAFALSRIYNAPVDVSWKMRGLAEVAAALNNNDIARAQIATLLMKLPDPHAGAGSNVLEKFNALLEAGWIDKDWDPAKHPRTGAPPNPGWFATTDGGGNENSSKPVGVNDADAACSNASASFRLEIAPLAAFPGATRDARIIPVAGGEEDERLPEAERDDEEGAMYFNPDTGETVTLRPGSGVVLGRPWIKVPDLPTQTYLRAPATETWVNPGSLDRHYVAHADDFDAKDEEDYAAKANKFYMESVSQGYRRRVDTNGTEYIYDPKTNTFGMYTIDGKTITFFKPTSKNYWNTQPGFVVKRQECRWFDRSEDKVVNHPSRYYCHICGYPGLEEPPRKSSGGGSHEICPCCGFQFGYHDDDQGLTYDEWRRRWVNKGMMWSDRRTSPPLEWNPRKQLIDYSRKFHLIRTQEDFDRGDT